MTQRYGDDATIREVLTGIGDTWAVVGLGDNPERPAYDVARFLQQRLGKRIVPVHPRAQTVHGEPGYRSLEEIPFTVDVVDLFVNSTRVGPLVDEAVRIGAKAVWLQVGVVDAAAFSRARRAGLLAVMDTCPKIEAPRLGLA